MSSTADPDEAAAVAYLAKLAESERRGERTTLAIGPYSAIVLIGGLQLAMRHPGMGDATRATLGQIVDDLRPLFDGTQGQAIVEAGDDPAKDR